MEAIYVDLSYADYSLTYILENTQAAQLKKNAIRYDT